MANERKSIIDEALLESAQIEKLFLFSIQKKY